VRRPGELHLVEFAVEAAPLHQFVVRAGLDDAAPVQHDDEVRFLNG
jgi:hypothetical protein